MNEDIERRVVYEGERGERTFGQCTFIFLSPSGAQECIFSKEVDGNVVVSTSSPTATAVQD